jgi:hypothetical protein
MAVSNNNLVLTGLDFDTLKTNLKNFLSTQDVYKDYDLEASNMAVLIDVLSYNSFLNAFYTNMMLSESFLDSAQRKNSVISHAKELNYMPRSARSAEALINLSFFGTSSTYLLQKGQTFSATVKSNTYNFSVSDNILLSSANGYFQTQLSLFEGVYLYDTYVMNTTDPLQRFLLSNPDCDITSLTVVVYEDNSITGTPYTLATTLLGLDELSKVFFVQQAENGQYEVEFGDGIVGYMPKNGSTISLNYRVCHGSDPNGASVFTINFNPGPTQDAFQINVSTISVASAGANTEDIDSIRYYAPRHFQIQEKASASEDYSIMLREQFPEITAVSTFGGEELNPPMYGYVAVVVNIDGVDGLPDSKRQAYTTFLKQRNNLTTQITFVDPLFSYLAVNTNVNYNINITTLTPDNIRTLVVNGIAVYAQQNLGDFESRFRYSRFCSMIDNIDASIVGNETEVLLYKKITPQAGTAQNIQVNFAMPLQFGVVQPNNEAGQEFHSFYSGSFYMNGYLTRLEDDGKGNVYYVNSATGTDAFVTKVGTINYDSGLISLQAFNPTTYDGNHIKMFVKPRELDILTDKATILDIENSEINVSVNVVRE